MKYVPVDSLTVPRFAGIKTFMRLPNIRTNKDIDYAIVGVPFDTATTYRPGARFGPSAIRDISSLIKPYNPALRVNVTEILCGIDYGDVSILPGYIDETYAAIENSLDSLVENNVTTICLGGDHSISLGELRSIAKFHGPVALIHFDAHFDTVDSYFGKKYNHGTVFARACEEGLIDTLHSIQVGMRGTYYSEDDLHNSLRLGFDVISGFELHDIGIAQAIKRIQKRVCGKTVFISFDIDFIDPAYAPGTGTIEVGGFTGHEALSLIRGLRGIQLAGADIVEVLPAYDSAQTTAFLAANIVFEILSLLALNKQNNSTNR